MITRFSVMPKSNVILGLDAAKIFDAGVVYSVTKILDQIILTPIGEMDLPEIGYGTSLCSDYKSIIHSGLHIMTKDEMSEIRINRLKEASSEQLYDCTDCQYNTEHGGGCGSGLLEYGSCGDHSLRGTM